MTISPANQYYMYYPQFAFPSGYNYQTTYPPSSYYTAYAPHHQMMDHRLSETRARTCAPSYKKVEPWGLDVIIRKRELHNLKIFFAKKEDP
jgi:hypothetical protein